MRADGTPIVLTADRTLMARYDVLLDAMVAAVQTTRIPAFVMRGILMRRMPMNGTGASLAPLGLRRIEAALVRAGIDRQDVVIVPPEGLRAVVGPATRVIGVSSGDPLGLGMTTNTIEATFGGRAHTPRWFRRLLDDVRRLKDKHAPAVVVGGPGAWQLVQHPEMRQSLGIDTVVTGYAEAEAPALIKGLLNGTPAPPVVEAKAPADIPPILGPTSMGAVEVSRGCGLGCDFCAVARQRVVHLPIDAIVADVETNVRAGQRNVVLLAEDLFRYGAAGADLNPTALLRLAEAVRQVAGVRLVQVDHVSVSALARTDDATLRAVRETLAGPTGDTGLWVNIGVETAAGRLLAQNGGTAKMRPFGPEEWETVAEQAVRRLAQAGFVPMLSLVMGLPGEEPADVERTVRFVDRLHGLRVLIFPVFFAPVAPEQRAFGIADMTPLHWRLFRRSYAFNFRNTPAVYWRNQRAGGVALPRRLFLQAAGHVQTLQWHVRFLRNR